MKTENFDDSIRRKIENINPEFGDEDLDKVLNYVNKNNSAFYFRRYSTIALATIAIAVISGLLVWNFKQRDEHERLVQTISKLHSDLSVAETKPQPQLKEKDTVYIKEYITNEVVHQNVISNNSRQTEEKNMLAMNPERKSDVPKEIIPNNQQMISPEIHSNNLKNSIPDSQIVMVKGNETIHSDKLYTPDQNAPDKISLKQSAPDSSLEILKNQISLVKPIHSDTMSLPQKKNDEYVKRSNVSKIFLSAFYSPKKINNSLSDNDIPDHLTVNDIETREGEWSNYTVGLRVGYEISPSLSLQTGCSYDISSFSILPTIIQANIKQDGQVGYSVTTSSGEINLSYPSVPNIGDSIKIKGTSSRNFVRVPLQLNYYVAGHGNIRAYVSGGLAANFAVYETSKIHWQNTMLNEGELSENSIEGLDHIHFSYTLGAGVRYNIWSKLSVFTEPYIQGSLTSINKAAPIRTKPFYYGCALGLSWKLG